MALTALEIKDKTFSVKFRGYNEDEVNDFLDIIVSDYEDLIRRNRDQENRIKDLEEKLAYFDDMKESLSQSVIIAQETSEKVKESARDEAANMISKATYDSHHLLDESKLKANQILRDATDEAKRIAIETEELKRETRIFHQRLLAEIEGQLSLANSSTWDELLQPTAIHFQSADESFNEVAAKVLDEDSVVPINTVAPQEFSPEPTTVVTPEFSPKSTTVATSEFSTPVSDSVVTAAQPDPIVAQDAENVDATRQFTTDEMEELQRRVAESNKQLEDAGLLSVSSEPILDLGETQTFKLNI